MFDQPPLYGDPWSNTVPVPAVPPPVPLPVTAPMPGADPIIVQIGEIQVSSTTVHTPAGQFPLKGSQWTVTDQWMAEQKIPTWAIVCAIVGFFCLTFFSLLFLLVKETVYSGIVLVQVHSGP